MSDQQIQSAEGGRYRTAGVGLGLAMALAIPISQAQLLPEIGPQVRIDPGGGTAAANETTASVSEANPMEIIAGWNDWRQSNRRDIINSGFSLSLDAGQTWSDFLIRPPEPYQSWAEGDPMTAFDPRTGTLWAGAISWGNPDDCLYVARKNPGASEFLPSVAARLGGLDKCWMAAGPRPGMPDTTRLYVAFNEGVIWSDDMGDTWTSPHSLGSAVGFLPRVGPNGELYVGYYYACANRLMRSLDGGETFTMLPIATRMDFWGIQDGSRFPGRFRVPHFLYFDVNMTDGTLYACYFDTTDIVDGNYNVDLYFTTSTDQGTTWSEPVIVNGDADPPGDQFWCWIECDKHGRLHMVYLDSRHTVQDDDVEHGMFDAYYSYSVNGGETWHEFRLTPNSWDSYNDGLGRRAFLGDYLGLAVAGNRAYPVYLDTSSGDPDIFTNVIELPVWGDTNGDDVVDHDDLVALLSDWGPCDEPDGCGTDINGDGVIDVVDLLILLGQWT
jgi:hypothetical protein